MEDTAKLSEALSRPFSASDLEWRVGMSGKYGDKMWALVLVYIQARAVMDRLDEAAGPLGWSDEYRAGPGGGVLCGITIGGITKWDGAENTDIESVKGGLSDAFKRAFVKWSPAARMLYKFKETFAECSTTKREGWNKAKDKKSGTVFWWKTPELPEWYAGKDGQAAADSEPRVPDDDQPADKAPAMPKSAAQDIRNATDNKGLAAVFDMHAATAEHEGWFDEFKRACTARKMEIQRAGGGGED